jgi:carbamate kinase
MARNLVVAVGGNALIKDNNNVSTDGQEISVAETCDSLVALIKAGYGLVVTHGNGPQVGFLLRRVELAAHELPSIPLDILGADTQGATGYMFVRELNGRLIESGTGRKAVAMVTQSVVDKADPAFQNPTKPIGSFMTEAEAKQHKEDDGWAVVSDSGRGWRRVVPSPQPKEIVEADAISELIGNGYVVVAGGGGGIPVAREGKGLVGIEAVIDKDLASALLANQLGVEDYVICTAVEQVYVNFGKPDQKALDCITVDDAKGYLAEGQFGVGSMEPKVRAAIEFLENGGKRVIITSLEKMLDALDGKAGTTITN